MSIHHSTDRGTGITANTVIILKNYIIVVEFQANHLTDKNNELKKVYTFSNYILNTLYHNKN